MVKDAIIFFFFPSFFLGMDFVTNFERFLEEKKGEVTQRNLFCGWTDSWALSRRKEHVGRGGHPATAARGRIDLDVNQTTRRPRRPDIVKLAKERDRRTQEINGLE